MDAENDSQASENDLRVSVEDITVAWLKSTLTAKLEGTPKASIEKLTALIVELLCSKKKPSELEGDLKSAVSDYAAQ